INRLQALPAGFDLLLTAEGQYAWDPLLSSEEFGYGGQRLGRGYDASAIVGDHGIAGGIELRKSHVLPKAGVALQPYAFYDIGKVWNIDPSSKDQQSGSSTGLGLRGSHQDGWQADLSLAIPLTRRAEDAPGYAAGDGARLYLQLRRDF
ncbi:MAG: ShlB/FhaC/HecB family hemolysin secretion/activation protein, partial [Pseudomonas sp.]